MLVGEDAGGHSGSVVSAEAYEHQAHAGYLQLGLKVQRFGDRCHLVAFDERGLPEHAQRKVWYDKEAFWYGGSSAGITKFSMFVIKHGGFYSEMKAATGTAGL